MTLHPAAFRVGEFAKLASAEKIRALSAEYADNWIVFNLPEMEQHAGKRVVIVQNAWPFPGVAYRVEEVLFKEKQHVSILGVWSEEALIDYCISTDIENEPYRRVASEVYTATADNNPGSGMVGMVSIHDREGQLFCRFRDDYASETANSINRIAKLRCRGSFEQYFGFDGDYSGYSSPDECESRSG